MIRNSLSALGAIFSIGIFVVDMAAAAWPDPGSYSLSIETYVYDCRRLEPSADILNCVCARKDGKEEPWNCVLPLPKDRSGRPSRARGK